MSDPIHQPWQGYRGQLWDAPMTDDMPKIDMAGSTCSMCQEEITATDDGLRLGSSTSTPNACSARPSATSLTLEGRCLCFGGGDHDEEGTYREQAQRALAWIIENGRGRWASE